MAEQVSNQFDGRAHNVVQANYVDQITLGPVSPSVVPNQVPAPTPNFTNQVTALARASGALVHGGDQDGPKTLVISGGPGIGKTELAFRLAQDRGAEYPDGRFLVDLSGSATGTDLVSERLMEFLVAVGFLPGSIPTSLAGRTALWHSWTTGRRVLVVVRNAHSPAQVSALLPGPGRSAVLVTASGGLAGLVARGAVAFVELEPLEPEADRRLLTELVGAARAAAEPAEFDRLLEFCAGYPIALCVVGAMLIRARHRKLARLVAELADEQTRLAALSRDRNLSVSAVFADAYRQLDEAAQRTFRAIGCHPATGELGMDVLVAMVGDAGGFDGLVDVALVRELADDRLVVHELPRLYAKQVTRADPTEHAFFVARMLAYYLRAAVECGHTVAPNRGWLDRFFPDLVPTAPVPNAAHWLSTERANLREIVALAHDRGEHLMVCQFAIALWPFHDAAKHVDDELAVNELAVRSALALGRPDLASLAHTQQGFAHRDRAESDKAVECLATAVIQAGADPALAATALEGLGLVQLDRGELAEAADSLRRNLSAAQRLGNGRRLALARFHLAKALPAAEALPLLDLAEFASEPVNTAKVLTWRGKKLIEAGEFTDAADALGRALHAMTELDRPFDQAVALAAIGDLARALGALADARRHYRQALLAYQQLGFAAHADRVRALLDELGPDDQPPAADAQGEPAGE